MVSRFVVTDNVIEELKSSSEKLNTSPHAITYTYLDMCTFYNAITLLHLFS
jgi:hypothetical protein